MKYFRLDSGVDAVWNVGTWLRKHVGTKGQYWLLTNYTVRTTCRGRRASQRLRLFDLLPLFCDSQATKAASIIQIMVITITTGKLQTFLLHEKCWWWWHESNQGWPQSYCRAHHPSSNVPNQQWRHWLKFMERSRWGNGMHSCQKNSVVFFSLISASGSDMISYQRSIMLAFLIQATVEPFPVTSNSWT